MASSQDMWYQLEGQLDGRIKHLEIKNDLMLVHARPLIISKENFLNIKEDELTFFRRGDRINPINLDTLICDLVTTPKDPLVIRYPYSNSYVSIDLKCSKLSPTKSVNYAHDTGLFFKVHHLITSEFKYIENEMDYKCLCVCVVKNVRGKIELKNETEVQGKTKFDEFVSLNIRDPNLLKIQIEVKFLHKKAFSDWKLSEVFSLILNQPGKKKLEDFEAFEKVELKELKTNISDGNWNSLIADLDLILKHFKVNIVSKETPKRLIIDSILKCIIRAFKESQKEIIVGLEEDLDGKFGHGCADYVLFWLKFMIVLIEAKDEDYIGGVGQLIVEMDCVMGNLPKRSGRDRPPVYGIVTDSFRWFFLMYEQTVEAKRVKVSKPVVLDPGNIRGNIRLVLEWIMLMIERQIENSTDVPDEF